MSKRKGVVLALATSTMMSCGVLPKDNGNKGDGDIVNEKERGCLQGVALDGLSGERLHLKTGKIGEEGIYVSVRNKMIAGHPLIANPDAKDANESLIGEYYLCGFPLDEEFPVFAFAEG